MGEESPAAAADRGARNSGLLEWATRLGLVGYGIVHLLIAWVAIRVAVGGTGDATAAGALSQLAHDQAGRATLGLLTAGFASLAVWQAITAAVGYRALAGRMRLLMRLGAVCRTVVYPYFAVASGTLFLHPTSTGRSQLTTGRILDEPAGAPILAVTGLVVVAIGVGLMVFGYRRSFLAQLDETARTGDRRLPIVLVGQLGYVLKGAAFAVIGVLLGVVALTEDPRRTGGLDQSFQSLLGQTVGGPAVVVAGVGIGFFGLYLFVRAWHLTPHLLTS